MQYPARHADSIMKTAIKEKKPTAVPEETLQIVAFRVGTAEYGLDINTITEAIRPLRIMALPRMPAFIEGVINLRGMIIPVVDLRKRFAVPVSEASDRKRRMLIVRNATRLGKTGDAGLLGLVVDGVSEVLYLPKKDIRPAPDAATGELAEFISGVGRAGDRLIILLDVHGVLSRQERAELAEAEHVDH
jgi:purine-binding chemotaxis protein CheW